MSNFNISSLADLLSNTLNKPTTTPPVATETDDDDEVGARPRVSSQDIANYGTAAGSLLTGIGSIFGSIKGNKKPDDKKNPTQGNDNAATGNNPNNNSTEPTGYAWYVWVGAAAGAALVGWLVYKFIFKKD